MANQASPYFERAFTCPICMTKFETRALRGSTVRVKERESDYHMIYDGPSPLHYSIVVCPTCYYAAANTSFSEPLNKKIADQVAVALQALRREEPSFLAERDLPTVLRSFQLAIQSAQLKKASPGHLAGSVLGAGWIARELDDNKLELTYLNEARKQYELSYVKDKLPIGALDEVSMAYLVGELYRRTGYYPEAISWFGRALSARRGSIPPALDKLIRDQWSQARNDAAHAEANPDAATSLLSNQNSGSISSEAPPAAAANEPVVTTAVSKKNRAKVTLNSHIYQDQVEWISKVVNVVYNQGYKVTRDEVVRAMLDACRETLILDELTDLKVSNETELAEYLRTKLASI